MARVRCMFDGPLVRLGWRAGRLVGQRRPGETRGRLLDHLAVGDDAVGRSPFETALGGRDTGAVKRYSFHLDQGW